MLLCCSRFGMEQSWNMGFVNNYSDNMREDLGDMSGPEQLDYAAD